MKSEETGNYYHFTVSSQFHHKAEPYVLKFLPEDYMLSVPYTEIGAWHEFAKMRYYRPDECPITDEVFSLLTFKQWKTEFKEYLDILKAQLPEEHENALYLAKECCRQEGAPYSPPIEFIKKRKKRFMPIVNA